MDGNASWQLESHKEAKKKNEKKQIGNPPQKYQGGGGGLGNASSPKGMQWQTRERNEKVRVWIHNGGSRSDSKKKVCKKTWGGSQGSPDDWDLSVTRRETYPSTPVGRLEAERQKNTAQKSQGLKNPLDLSGKKAAVGSPERRGKTGIGNQGGEEGQTSETKNKNGGKEGRRKIRKSLAC